MNNVNTLPPLPPAPVRKKNTVLITVCALLFSFMILIGGGCFALFRSGTKQVDSAKIVADKFLKSLEDGDKKAAYPLLSSDVSKESLNDVLEVLAKRRGAPVAHTGPQGFYIRTTTEGTSVDLTYTEKFEKGEVPVQLVVVRSGDSWKVKAFNFRF